MALIKYKYQYQYARLYCYYDQKLFKNIAYLQKWSICCIIVEFKLGNKYFFLKFVYL